MNWVDPDKLVASKKLGREEFCQRVLTSLILGGPYPSWNSRNTPSDAGHQFLSALFTLVSGRSLDAPVEFVDEFKMPARDGDKCSGWPDYAMLWPGNLWIIELKTEKGSHRDDQLPWYRDLAAHHHGDRSLHLTYLTGPMDTQQVAMDGRGGKFAHIFWDQAFEVAESVWAESPHDAERLLLAALRREVANLHQPASGYRHAASQIRDALTLAPRVAETGEQAAVEISGGMQEMVDMRIRIRDALARDVALVHVRPWIWSRKSGGSAMTENGEASGYELRLSRYLD